MQKTAYEMRISDWSSDVCSSDLLAGAINASGAGVTASIIADEGGHRLILKGPTGEAGAFTLTADAGADPGLSTFATGGGMTEGQSAANAEFTIDGVAFSRASNIIDDVVPGMSLTLKDRKSTRLNSSH